MTISNDDIKSRVSVVDAARRITTVWEDNRRDRWVCRCLCGRSEDKTPSFKLWQDHAHCFSCQLHIANVFQLVMLGQFRNENFSDAENFKQARAWLIGEFFGAGISERELTGRFRPELEEASPVSTEVKAVLNAATDHYARVLWGDPAQPDLYPGKPEHLAYLRHKRGLTEATIQRLRIGYADNLTLARALYRHGIDLALAARVGLLPSDARGEFLRSRIVFPVTDDAGDVVYLIGRATQAWQDKRKYLGLAQTLVRKLPMVMGTPHRGAIWVEGPVDYAALVQWGLDPDYLLVCSLGTAHTRAIEIILARNPHGVTYVAADQDHAGDESVGRILRGLGEHFSTGVRVRWLGAKDAGELLLQSETGRAAFYAALHDAEQRLTTNDFPGGMREASSQLIRESFGISAEGWPDAMLLDCLAGNGFHGDM